MARRVAVLILDNVGVLDFAGPFEVFGVSRRREGRNLFDMEYDWCHRDGNSVVRYAS
jgi:hypothetical protein